jgi:formylglycine-generating enzyme required for sulfatase activity
LATAFVLLIDLKIMNLVTASNCLLKPDKYRYLVMVMLAASCGSPAESPLSTAEEIAPAPSPPASENPINSMVLIPAGSYPIGADETEDAAPLHQVSLAAFYLDRYEVTNAQYAQFLNSLNLRSLQDAPAGRVRPADLPTAAIPLLIEGDEGQQQNPLIALDDEHARIAIQNSQFVAQPDYKNHPVTETTWRGAQAYCTWRDARLPTEVEWEAAARGSADRTYPWGDEFPSPEKAVYGRISGATAAIGTHPAGATPEGIHDLAGNVAEWTSSLYRPYPYDASDGRELSDATGERVTRGGDHVFDSDPAELITSFRSGFSRAPDRGHRHIGFRCAQFAPL